MDDKGSPLLQRKRIRLKSFDYSANGAYFITICTKDRACLLGEIIIGQWLCPCRPCPMCRLSAIGEIVQHEIQNLPQRFAGVQVDKYVIMPNHIHMILVLNEQRQGQSPCPTVGGVVGALKSITTKAANQIDCLNGRKVWQFRFYDHIIRNEIDYQEIWQYIDNNLVRWEYDRLFQPS